MLPDNAKTIHSLSDTQKHEIKWGGGGGGGGGGVGSGQESVI